MMTSIFQNYRAVTGQMPRQLPLVRNSSLGTLKEGLPQGQHPPSLLTLPTPTSTQVPERQPPPCGLTLLKLAVSLLFLLQFP